MNQNIVRIFTLYVLSIILFSCTDESKPSAVKSPDGSNSITLSLNEQGQLFYTVERNNEVILNKSPLGLKRNDTDFTEGLALEAVSDVGTQRENYELKVSNFSEIDHEFHKRSITYKNKSGVKIIVDLLAGEEGVAFRYRFPDTSDQTYSVEKEITGFRLDQESSAWLQPYNKAGQYTPAYEDFYFNVQVGDSVTDPRNPSTGWCMPALFQTGNKKNWVLIAESGTDEAYSGCHLENGKENGTYQIAFANNDERFTLPISEEVDSKPRYTLPWTMPWRVIILGDDAGDILLSTLITDVAPASKIDDTSWIEAGKASWSWWSHPDDHSAEMYDRFTELSSSLNWSYTLFDAGWQDANESGDIINHAIDQDIQPLVWGYSGNYFKPEDRKKKLQELSEMGVKGIKIDFWCSDRQEAMAAIQSLFKEAAEAHILVNLHGSPMPRGWQRTWPNFVSAESVLGTESYFYDERFPDKASIQNTVLPFTRNVAGPTDYTPFALTIRKYPRLNTAVHELATAMIYTSGIIHFADSKEMYDSLPKGVKQLLKQMPATWDNTESILAEPGKAIVLHRRKDAKSYIIGINGTNEDLPVSIDLQKYAKNARTMTLISEGADPLMEFNVDSLSIQDNWEHTMVPKGGFIISFSDK